MCLCVSLSVDQRDPEILVVTVDLPEGGGVLASSSQRAPKFKVGYVGRSWRKCEYKSTVLPRQAQVIGYGGFMFPGGSNSSSSHRPRCRCQPRFARSRSSSSTRSTRYNRTRARDQP